MPSLVKMCRKCELTVLFSTDYPFHQPSEAAVGQFFDTIPDPADRSKIASGNAEALFHLT